MVEFVLSLCVSFIGGFLFKKMRVPAPFLMGGIIFVGFFNIFFEIAFCPKWMNLVLQVLSGLVIGVNIRSDYLKQLKKILLPMVFILFGLLLNNLFVGTVLFFTTRLDLATSLISSIPGGITESALAATQFGADVPTVAIMQLSRLVGSLLVFPLIIKYLTRNEKALNEGIEKEIEVKQFSTSDFLLSLLVATLCGAIGYFIPGLPTPLLVCSIIGVAFFNIKTSKAVCPKNFKKMVQVLAGLYVGVRISMDTVIGLKTLIIPVCILLLGYFVVHTSIGLLTSRIFHQDRGKMLFCTIPAGASDIALVASDMGYNSPDIAVFQMVRLLSCIIIFPSIIKIYMFFLNSVFL